MHEDFFDRHENKLIAGAMGVGCLVTILYMLFYLAVFGLIGWGAYEGIMWLRANR